jgi:betaine-aldehyde dehydrogenase
LSGRPPLPAQRDLVDGSWVVPPYSGVALVDPDTGTEFGRAANSTPETIDAAIAAAARVHGSGQWARLSSAERSQVLYEIADRLVLIAEEIAVADTVDSGVPIAVTRLFASALPGILHDAAEHAARLLDDRVLPSAGGEAHLLRVPWGPAAVLAPFNAPAFTAVKKTAYALAAGCPVILKPSPHAPHSAGLFATVVSAAIASRDAPAALFQLVHGDAATGVQLASDRRVRCLAFTGSRAGGRAVASAAAGDLKALQLECGSNNPAIVRADADVEAAARALAAGFTKLNGQWCERPGTVFVDAHLHDELLQALLHHLEKLQPGACLDDTTTFGPQAHPQQAATVDSAIARLEARGAIAHRMFADRESMGSFRGPTVITGADPADTLEEIFGPVLILHAVLDDAEALRRSNALEGGLAGYVFTRELPAGLAIGRDIAAGEVKINGTSVLDLTPESAQSFWTGSGIGGHGNADLIRFFTGIRIVGPDLPDAAL